MKPMSAQIADVVGPALARASSGQDFRFDITPQMTTITMPGGQPVPALVHQIIFTLRSPLLGAGPLTGTVILNGGHLTGKQAEEMVRAVTGKLREMARAQLATPPEGGQAGG